MICLRECPKRLHYLAKCIVVLVLLVTQSLISPSGLSAQISTYEDQLAFELELRDISKEEFYELLREEGYDPENLDNLSTTETIALKRLLEDYTIERFRANRGRTDQDTSDLGDLEDYEYGLDSLELLEDSLDLIVDTIPEVIFGHSYFRSDRISLVPTTRGYNPPETYLIGVGDELTVSIFGGSARVEDVLSVKSDGSVRIFNENVKVTLAGISKQEARIRLERSYRKEYRFSPNQFSLSVSAIRPVRVQVFGEVLQPGDFTVSAANGIINVIAAAGGMTDNGSVRKIKLIKRTGEEVVFDLYELFTNPQYQKNFSLNNGDFIVVPAAQMLASIEGPVSRPHTYEILDGDGLFDLIEYAGGLSGNASLRTMRINRYLEDKRVVKDVPYAERVKQNADYPLMNGDEVIITEILAELENYVTVKGEVRNPGNYELEKGMTLRDVIQYAGLKSSSKTDKAYLRRITESGSVSVIPVSIEDAVNGIGTSSQMVMQDKDEIEVWAKERFLDKKYIKVAGAVRFPEEVDYDNGGTMKAADLIELAGGLRSDAAQYAHVHRLDPFNPNKTAYVRLDLNRLMNDPQSADNVFLEPYDSLHVYSENDFQDDVSVTVLGAVNSPGQFIFGEGMSIKDAILLANGFKRSSATNRIEVSRVIIENNKPTETIIEQIAVDRNDLHNSSSSDFKLEPYDNIFVRYVPRFELQQNVYIKGEVESPGGYSLIKDNETLSDIVERAGGITDEAFPAAATLYRAQDSLGLMIMRLDEVLDNPSSLFNTTLLDGDTIYIPKRFNHVKILGATTYLQQRKDIKQIVAPFEKGKNALYYINNYGGGFADNARRDKIMVKYPNGEVKQIKKRFLLGKKYPEVLPGSEISVWTVAKDLRAGGDGEDVNWTKVLGDSVAQAMSILTLILLVQRLD